MVANHLNLSNKDLQSRLTSIQIKGCDLDTLRQSHLDREQLSIFIGHKTILSKHIVHFLDHYTYKQTQQQKVKLTTRVSILLVYYRCTDVYVSPSSPSCSLILLRSDPPTTPTRTRVLNFSRNSFISGVTH